jgi:cytochrome c oxidase assembly protein subunit 15
MTKPANCEKQNEKWLFLFWIYTIVVILWGAWVRISHSGNGCGNHWPLCQGQLLPDTATAHTWIEYSHRMMSGIYGLLVFYIYYKFRQKKYSETTRKLSLYMLIFMLLEAAVGALLVKGQLVTVNDSVFRLIIMSLHQLNSFLLTAVTYLLGLSLSHNLKTKLNRILIFFLSLCVLGAFASLSTTLFPSQSLWEGILSDLNSTSHLFVKLRILHPIFAVLIMMSLTYYYLNKKQTRIVFEIYFALAVGIMTLLTLSPVWLKISHLFIAHYLWSRLLRTELICDSKNLD